MNETTIRRLLKFAGVILDCYASMNQEGRDRWKRMLQNPKLTDRIVQRFVSTQEAEEAA